MTPDTTNNEENPRVKNLVQELCNQLAINREQTRQYKKQINELKSKIVEYNRSNYRGPSFFDAGSDIERQNAQLICENQSLNEENEALTLMVKDYEQSLKTIMMKFRYQAYEIQRSRLEMQRNYEILLEEQRATTAQVVSENVLLQSRLSNLGGLVREAYDAQSDMETDILLKSLVIENQGLRQVLDIADGTAFSTLSTSSTSSTSLGKKRDDVKSYITTEIKSNNNQISEFFEEKNEES